MYYIYKITNKINNKIYIGQTNDIKKRFNSHKNNKKSVISKAINKYGVDNFIFEIIETINTIEEANSLEIKYINKFNSIAPNGYNIASGGLNGNKYKGKTKEEMDVIKSKISTTMSEIRLLKNPFKGKHHTKETKNYLSIINSGERNPNSKPIQYYENHKNTINNFKRVCKRHNWDFNDFEKIYVETINNRKYYKYKYKNDR